MVERRTPHPAPRRRVAKTAPAASPTRRPHVRRRPVRKRSEVLLQVRTILIRLGILLGAGLFCYLIYIYCVAPTNSRWRAWYSNEVYPEGYSIRGIDISHHQGVIDWEKLSRAKIGDETISFVFVKATEGKNFLDENFNDNFYKAREYGIKRGAYHYFKPGVPAKDQARYFLRQVHLEEGDLPPVLDIEEAGGLSVEELQKQASTWLKIVGDHYKVTPIIYSGYKFRQKYLNGTDFEKYPYWIAHYYVRALSYKGSWKFWQHTDCGRLDGVKEKVDLNIYNGSMYDLNKLCLKDNDEEDI